MSDMVGSDHPERRLRFDGTITAGSLVSTLTFVIGLAAGWAHLEGRISRLEESKVVLQDRMDREGSEIKQTLRDVNSKLDRLIERLTPSPRDR